MNSLLVDSDVLIEVSRERDAALVARWRSLADSDVLVTVTPVSVAELWHGVRERESKALELLFSALLCLPADEQIGRRAGAYLHQFHASHGVELGDALIAATAATHSLPLWTRNRRHYPMRDIAFY